MRGGEEERGRGGEGERRRGGEGERGRGGEEERGRGGEGGERLMLHLASFQPCPRMELVAKRGTEMKALLAYLPTRQELGTSTFYSAGHVYPSHRERESDTCITCTPLESAGTRVWNEDTSDHGCPGPKLGLYSRGVSYIMSR